MFDIYFLRDCQSQRQQMNSTIFEIKKSTPSVIDYEIQFPLDVKTQGCLYVNISSSFDPEKVFIGNASETRFLTNSSRA